MNKCKYAIYNIPIKTISRLMLVLLGFPNFQRTCLEGINVAPCGDTLGKNTFSLNMLLANMVELRGIEPRTLCLQSRCSPS